MRRSWISVCLAQLVAATAAMASLDTRAASSSFQCAGSGQYTSVPGANCSYVATAAAASKPVYTFNSTNVRNCINNCTINAGCTTLSFNSQTQVCSLFGVPVAKSANSTSKTITKFFARECFSYPSYPVAPLNNSNFETGSYPPWETAVPDPSNDLSGNTYLIAGYKSNYGAYMFLTNSQNTTDPYPYYVSIAQNFTCCPGTAYQVSGVFFQSANDTFYATTGNVTAYQPTFAYQFSDQSFDSFLLVVNLLYTNSASVAGKNLTAGAWHSFTSPTFTAPASGACIFAIGLGTPPGSHASLRFDNLVVTAVSQ